MPLCCQRKSHKDGVDYAEIEAVRYRQLLGSSEFRLQMFGEQSAEKYGYQLRARTIVEREDTENYC